MNLQDYIEKGAGKCGSAANLAKLLDISASGLSDAKRGQRGLPSHMCVILAELIDVDPMEVIASSELVTEKKPERQALWKRVLEMRHAAVLALGFVLVTGFVTPQDANASNNKNLANADSQSIYIMSNYIKRLNL